MMKMKDSGIEWIGEIPNDWGIAQVRYLFKIGRGRVIAQTEVNENEQYPVYSSQTKNNGCLGYIDTYDFDLSQLTWTTDGANAGTVFLREGKHNCTNVCGTLQPLNSNLNLKFQKYALEHIAFYHKRADTNGFKIMNNEMAAIHTICPPIDIQQRIADYLDEKCVKIDKIIEKQQTVIEKLKEYKLSIITEAVTNGLNQDVEMKDSGIECIGKIPVHWTIRRASTLSERIVVGVVIRPSEYFDSNGTIPFLRGMNVKDFKISTKDLVFISEESNKVLNKSIVHEGDILIVRDGNIGASCIVPKELDGSNVVSMIIFTANSECTSNYICYCLNSCVGKNQFEITKIGSALTHTSVSAVSRLIFSTPPIEEQRDIVAYLDKKCDAIDKTIESKYTIVEKLIEYKKSLIYEVVTGKKEV